MSVWSGKSKIGWSVEWLVSASQGGCCATKPTVNWTQTSCKGEASGSMRTLRTQVRPTTSGVKISKGQHKRHIHTLILKVCWEARSWNWVKCRVFWSPVLNLKPTTDEPLDCNGLGLELCRREEGLLYFLNGSWQHSSLGLFFIMGWAIKLGSASCFNPLGGCPLNRAVIVSPRLTPLSFKNRNSPICSFLQEPFPSSVQILGGFGQPVMHGRQPPVII